MVYSVRMRLNLRQIIGLIVWWTEGTKTYKDKRWKNSWFHHVEVTNTNHQIIQAFLNFLRKDIGVNESRLKLQLQIHEGDNKADLENFWSQMTSIPLSRFNKTIIRPKGRKIGKTKGTCKIRYCDKATQKKLTTYLEKLLAKTNGV